MKSKASTIQINCKLLLLQLWLETWREEAPGNDSKEKWEGPRAMEFPPSTSLLPLHRSQPLSKLEKTMPGDINKPYKTCPKAGQS